MHRQWLPVLALALSFFHQAAHARMGSWTGWYVGANAGVAGEKSERSLVINPENSVIALQRLAGATAPVEMAIDGMEKFGAGFIGGGQIGLNWEFAPRWVAGFESDLSYVALNQSDSVTTLYAGSHVANQSAATEMDWLFTLRPRFGYVAGSALLYVTSGLAVASVKTRYSFLGTPPFPGYYGVVDISTTHTPTGWVIGAGAEWSLPNTAWTVKAEFLYMDFGNIVDFGELRTVGAASPPGGFNYENHLTVSVARLGLNYGM